MSQHSKKPTKPKRQAGQKHPGKNDNPLHGMDFNEALEKLVSSPKIKKQASK